LLKRLNTGKIVARILEGGTISRAELARQAEISPATVSVLIADLIEQGIVVEVGPGDSVRGRRPTLIQLNPDGAAIVVASIRPTHFIVGVSDLTSHLRHVHEESYPPEAPPESVVPILSDALAALVAQTSAEGRPVLGVGVSTVGIIRPTDASVIQSPNQPRWREVHLGEMLRERLGQAVYVANDARTLALAEMIYGGGRKYRHMVCLSVTEGIGAGVVIDGHICWGKSGNAGELGHTVVDPDGRMCGCGKRGCLEAMASERALLAAVGPGCIAGLRPADSPMTG
jgi:predicted NBD/HSP70 family sugar kinase